MFDQASPENHEKSDVRYEIEEGEMASSIFSRFVLYEQKAAEALATLAGFGVFVMMMITVTDVFLIATRLGTVGIAVESIEMLMIVVVFGSFAYADVLDKHVNATMIVDRLPPRARVLFDLFGYCLSLCICVILTWQMFGYAHHATAIRKTCLSSELPYYPFTWFAVAGFFLFDLQYAKRILRALRGLKEGGRGD
jgi:TRAP-type C4-dicarboxylate transport system permease small subunit